MARGHACGAAGAGVRPESGAGLCQLLARVQGGRSAGCGASTNLRPVLCP